MLAPARDLLPELRQNKKRACYARRDSVLMSIVTLAYPRIIQPTLQKLCFDKGMSSQPQL